MPGRLRAGRAGRAPGAPPRTPARGALREVRPGVRAQGREAARRRGAGRGAPGGGAPKLCRSSSGFGRVFAAGLARF